MSRDVSFSVSDEVREFADFYADLRMTTASAIAKKGLIAEMKRHPLSASEMGEYEKRHGPAPIACLRGGARTGPHAILNTPSSPRNTKEASEDKEIARSLEAAFTSRHGPYSDFASERKTQLGLVSKARAAAPEHPSDFLKAVLEAFWKLKQGPDKFWRGTPFTPKGLSPLWDRVLETMRTPGQDAALAVVAGGVS